MMRKEKKLYNVLLYVDGKAEQKNTHTEYLQT